MESVSGIGGVFFRADDPTALGKWYAEYLGFWKSPPTTTAQFGYKPLGPRCSRRSPQTPTISATRVTIG